MKTKPTEILLALTLSSMIALPTYARGFGGGGGGGGFRGGGGGGFRGGGGSGFRGGGGGGGAHDFGGAGRGFSGSGFGGGGNKGFGGGFNGLGGSAKPISGGQHPNFGNQGFGNKGGFGEQGLGNRSGFGNRPEGGFNNPGIGNHPNYGHLPTDGGLGGIAGQQHNVPHNINQNNLNHQGNNIRNSFNNNSINNVNVNRYGGGYGAYGHAGYGSGWAHGYAASNAWHGGAWGYPGAWGCPGWSEAAMWTSVGISSLTSFLGLGMIAAASSGNKSSGGGGGGNVTNVTYEGDNVYVNGQPAGTSAQYYGQAQQLAAKAALQQQTYQAYPAYQPYGANNPYQPYGQTQYQTPGLAPMNPTAPAAADANEKWEPLGVFALAEPGQTQSNMLMQLAINQKGIVRGNYMNQLTNEKSQIYGALDKTTQRISWTIGENNSTVFDTSLGGLTKDDSQVLVHYGPTNTQEMALIRLPAPKETQNQGAPQMAPTS